MMQFPNSNPHSNPLAPKVPGNAKKESMPESPDTGFAKPVSAFVGTGSAGPASRTTDSLKPGLPPEVLRTNPYIHDATGLGFTQAELLAMAAKPHKEIDQAVETRRLSLSKSLTGLPDASAERIRAMRAGERMNPGEFGIESPASRSFAIARYNAGVERDRRLASGSMSPLRGRDIPRPGQSSAHQAIAEHLRIDTRNMDRKAVAYAIQQRIARLNGINPTGRTVESLQAENRARSLNWLSGQTKSGISFDRASGQYKVKGADGKLKAAGYPDILQGYRNVYGLSKNATFADIFQTWKERAGASLMASPNSIRGEAFKAVNTPAESFFRKMAGLDNSPVSKTPTKSAGTTSRKPSCKPSSKPGAARGSMPSPALSMSPSALTALMNALVRLLDVLAKRAK